MKGKNRMRILSVLLAICSLLCCFAACGEQTADSTSCVRMNLNAEPDSLDPWLSAASDTEAVFHNVFEGLTGFDEQGDITPALAKSWSIDESGLVYTFTLRDDVTFHNGAKLTAADVVYTYESLTGLSGGEPLTQKFDMVSSVEAMDDYTVKITLSEPSPAFLTLTKIAVLPQGYTEQSTHPIGTGPYKFVEYTPSQRIVFEKNEDYYGIAEGDEPDNGGKIDRIEVYIMSDSASVVSALRSGQLDMATMLEADDADILESEFTVYSGAQNMVQGLFVNNSVKPFDDIRVRQALCYAIDRTAVIDTVFGGYATAVYSNFSPVMASYYNSETESTYSYDPEKARALLTEAGYPDGFTATVKVPALYQQHIDTAQVLAQQLSQVGITMKIETVEWATWLDDVYTNANYELTITGLSGKLDPDSILGRYHSQYSKNFFCYQNDEYDSLIDAAKAEPDEEQRIEDYKKCQKILTDDAAAVYLCDPNLIVACRKDLTGFAFYPVAFYDFTKLSYTTN